MACPACMSSPSGKSRNIHHDTTFATLSQRLQKRDCHAKGSMLKGVKVGTFLVEGRNLLCGICGVYLQNRSWVRKEKPMGNNGKVLMLVENLPAPADSRVWPEATTLREHGFQVSIISPKGESGHQESHVCIDDIHIYRYKLPTFQHKYIH